MIIIRKTNLFKDALVFLIYRIWLDINMFRDLYIEKFLSAAVYSCFTTFTVVRIIIYQRLSYKRSLHYPERLVCLCIAVSASSNLPSCIWHTILQWKASFSSAFSCKTEKENIINLCLAALHGWFLLSRKSVQENLNCRD